MRLYALAGLSVAALVAAIAGTSRADSYNGIQEVRHNGSALTATTGTFSSGVTATTGTFSDTLTCEASHVAEVGSQFTGAMTSACVGDSLSLDNNGLQACGLMSDTLPDSVRVHGHDAAPLGAGANQVGGNLRLQAGNGTRRGAVTAASFVDDTTTVTIPLDGTNNVGTEGTAFECDSVTDAVCATNIATWADALTGIDSCAGAGCTLFTGVAGTFYVWRAPDEPGVGGIGTLSTSTGSAVTFVNGTDGLVTTDQHHFAVGAGKRVYLDGGGDTYVYEHSANQVRIITGGTAALTLTATAFSAAATMVPFMPGLVKDVGATCSAGEMALDSAGGTVEWCVCQAANTWMCVPVTSGPDD